MYRHALKYVGDKGRMRWKSLDILAKQAIRALSIEKQQKLGENNPARRFSIGEKQQIRA